MSTTRLVEIKPKSAGPEGMTPAAGPIISGNVAKVLIAGFVLEDYVDSIIAHQALNDPENSERIPWEKLKSQLGL
jgi:hypothetical protein